MRLQLIGVLLAVASPAFAEVADQTPGSGDATGSLGLYSDSDKTTVVTSVAQASVRLPQPITVSTHALIDAVSSASVDVVSAATTRFTENRIELGAAAQLGLGKAMEGSVGYTHSGENDWQSHAVELGLTRDLAHKNAKLGVGYGFTRNSVGRAHDPNFEKTLDVQGVQLGLTQIIDKKTLGSLSYTLSSASGYQGSPYRFVTTMDGVVAPESPPDQRMRHAVTLRLMHMFGTKDVVDASYRLYLDDWGIVSNTVEASLTRQLADAWTLRARVRGYRQSHAGFYAEQYEMPATHMTIDRELSTFWDAMGGLKLAYHGEHWDLDAKIDSIVYRFEDYARLRGRVAIVSGMGATWRW